MSQENVEVARALWAGLERGDVRLDLCDEQIELRTAAEIPVADEYRGHDGVRQWATDVWEVFSEFHNEVEEVIAEGDRVVLRCTLSGTHEGPFMGIPPTGRKIEVRSRPGEGTKVTVRVHLGSDTPVLRHQ
jgi:hypothetical protein